MDHLKLRLAIVAFALAMTGCVSTQGGAGKSVFSATEAELDTGGPRLETFHALAYYPWEYALRYPGIVVGVEKSKEKKVKSGAIPEAIDTAAVFVRGDDKANDFLRARLLGDPKILGESKVMFISHVLRTSPESGQERLRPCFLYNVYRPETGPGRADIDGVESCNGPDPDVADYFSGSWQAIQGVKQALKRDLESGNYTHLVVIVMGWNTQQTEAIQNFNSLVDRLKQTAPGGSDVFKPYVIGVTWPSEWVSDLINSAAHAVSLPDKANDADELGSGWLGALINYAVRPTLGEIAQARPTVAGPKLLVIGHSFGARATSHAVCRGSLLKVPKHLQLAPGVLEKGQVDWLVGLQGAYSLNRFGNTGAGFIDLRYDPDCDGARHLIFTASSHDEAANGGGLQSGLQSVLLDRDANYAGNLRSFDNVLSGELSVPKFVTYRTTLKPGQAAGSGNVDPVGPGDGASRKFIYVDASNVIYFNSYGTAAGAHSDIYRTATARVLWKMMEVGEKR